jgi:hypothetical protein
MHEIRRKGTAQIKAGTWLKEGVRRNPFQCPTAVRRLWPLKFTGLAEAISRDLRDLRESIDGDSNTFIDPAAAVEAPTLQHLLIIWGCDRELSAMHWERIAIHIGVLALMHWDKPDYHLLADYLDLFKTPISGIPVKLDDFKPQADYNVVHRFLRYQQIFIASILRPERYRELPPELLVDLPQLRRVRSSSLMTSSILVNDNAHLFSDPEVTRPRHRQVSPPRYRDSIEGRGRSQERLPRSRSVSPSIRSMETADFVSARSIFVGDDEEDEPSASEQIGSEMA